MTDETIGLILSDDGARAAYQVGVSRAIAGMLRQRARNPVAVICGTSAGAPPVGGLIGFGNSRVAA